MRTQQPCSPSRSKKQEASSGSSRADVVQHAAAQQAGQHKVGWVRPVQVAQHARQAWWQQGRRKEKAVRRGGRVQCVAGRAPSRSCGCRRSSREPRAAGLPAAACSGARNPSKPHLWALLPARWRPAAAGKRQRKRRGDPPARKKGAGSRVVKARQGGAWLPCRRCAAEPESLTVQGTQPSPGQAPRLLLLCSLLACCIRCGWPSA